MEKLNRGAHPTLPTHPTAAAWTTNAPAQFLPALAQGRGSRTGRPAAVLLRLQSYHLIMQCSARNTKDY